MTDCAWSVFEAMQCPNRYQYFGNLKGRNRMEALAGLYWPVFVE